MRSTGIWIGKIFWSISERHPGSNTVALVRVAELNGGLVKRALDIGADGVLFPWIETKAQLEQAIAFASYPPEGVQESGRNGQRDGEKHLPRTLRKRTSKCW